MTIDLSGKTAFVSASTGGIGFAIAKLLGEAGAVVVVNGRKQDKVDAAVSRIGGQARGATVDLSSAEGHAQLVKAEPSFDIVVSNLGVFAPADFFDTDDAEWDRHWQVNVMPATRLARSYLPGMKERGWGRLLLVSSTSAFMVPVENIHYAVSKVAEVALARGLAKRMAGTGVTVNSLLPGFTLSDGVAAALADERGRSGKPIEEGAADFVRKNRPTSIIQRAASVDEVANMAAYLVSPLASATTGAAVRVDGGTIDSLM